jgi:hypothetical protein
VKNILKLEELAMLAISIYGLYVLNVPWWCYLLLALGPDISMVGYLAGNKVGAVLYNLFHHKGLAVVLFLVGLILPDRILEITGIIMFGHASLDRVFGYGLKFSAGFGHTHLGMIGKEKNVS